MSGNHVNVLTAQFQNTPYLFWTDKRRLSIFVVKFYYPCDRHTAVQAKGINCSYFK